jgi:hypothetical protein
LGGIAGRLFAVPFATMESAVFEMSIQNFSISQNRIVIKANMVAIIVLVVFSTAFAPFIGAGQRNFLVIGLSGLMPLLLLAYRLPLKRDVLWAGAVVLYLVSISLLKGTTSDISSIAYTVLFILPYLFFVGCLNKGIIKREAIVVFLKRLILVFAALSVAQFVAALGGLPVPNEIVSKGLWSHNSLSVEPSHLGRALSVSIFVYLVLLRTERTSSISPMKLLYRERLVVAAFLIAISLSGSTLAVMAAPLALMLAFSFRWIMFLIVLGIFLVPFAQTLEIEALQRGIAFVGALPTMDIWALANADHSGSVRVMPALVYLSEADPSTAAFWFGQGLSEISLTLAGKLLGVGDGFEGGFFPGFGIAFGAVGLVLMSIAFVFRFLRPQTTPFILFWLVLFLASPWNTQLFWYGLMMLRVLHYFDVLAHTRSTKQTLTVLQTSSGQS